MEISFNSEGNMSCTRKPISFYKVNIAIYGGMDYIFVQVKLHR